MGHTGRRDGLDEVETYVFGKPLEERPPAALRAASIASSIEVTWVCRSLSSGTG